MKSRLLRAAFFVSEPDFFNNMGVACGRAIRLYYTGLSHIGRYPLLSLTHLSESEFTELRFT